MNARKRPAIGVLHRLVLGVVLVSGFGFDIPAMETDPFLALDVELADSSDELNLYVNEVFEKRLKVFNRRHRGSEITARCEEAALFAMEGFRRPLFSRIAHWAHTDPAVQRHPEIEMAGLDYYRASILGVPYYHYLQVPLGRTVNVNGVYLGADKLGHFLSFGARYYRRFTRRVRRGEDPVAATRAVIRWGLKQEKQFVGGWVTGVVSFGDLEANYQGLRLGRALCEGHGGARLVRDRSGTWSLDQPLDVTPFVNPDWDEAFNPSFFKPHKWDRVERRLHGHCEKLHRPDVRARLDSYRRSYEPSFNAHVLAEWQAAGLLPGRRRFTLEQVCSTVTIATAD